jgi:hypothetical protein
VLIPVAEVSAIPVGLELRVQLYGPVPPLAVQVVVYPDPTSSGVPLLVQLRVGAATTVKVKGDCRVCAVEALSVTCRLKVTGCGVANVPDTMVLMPLAGLGGLMPPGKEPVYDQV